MQEITISLVRTHGVEKVSLPPGSHVRDLIRLYDVERVGDGTNVLPPEKQLTDGEVVYETVGVVGGRGYRN